MPRRSRDTPIVWDKDKGIFKLGKDPIPARPVSAEEKRARAQESVTQLLMTNFGVSRRANPGLKVPAHLRQYVRERE